MPITSKIQKKLAARNCKDVFKNEDGAIDLASIMVGIIVIGIIGGVIAATVFSVIPRAQDNGAKQALSAVQTAETSYFGINVQYATFNQMVSANYINDSNNVVVDTNTKGTCYAALSLSNSGKIYFSSDTQQNAKLYVAGTTTSSCVDLPTLMTSLLVNNPTKTPIVNLAVGGSFESSVSNSLIVTNRNLFTNPRQVASGASNASFTPITGVTGFGGITTAGTSTADAGWKSFWLNGAMPYNQTAATPMTVTFWAQVNQTGWILQDLTDNIAIPASWGGVLKRADTGTVVSDLTGDNIPHQYTLTFTVPTTQVTVWQFGFKQNSATADATKTLTVTGASATVSNSTDYFDGTTAASGDFSYSWVGAANASQSIQTGKELAGVSTASTAAVIQSSDWSSSGSTSARVVPKSSTTNDSYLDVLPMVGGVSAMKANTTYTIMATERIANAQTGTINGNEPRGFFVYFNNTRMAVTGTLIQAPNTPGVYQLKGTFTTPAAFTGTNTIRLYNGTFSNNGDIWYDDFALVQGTYAGSYFDGSSDKSYWLGTPNNSQSVTY